MLEKNDLAQGFGPCIMEMSHFGLEQRAQSDAAGCGSYSIKGPGGCTRAQRVETAPDDKTLGLADEQANKTQVPAA